MNTAPHAATELLLDAHEVGRQLGISAYNVRAHRKRGNLPAINISTGTRPTWRWRQSTIDQFTLTRRT